MGLSGLTKFNESDKQPQSDKHPFGTINIGGKEYPLRKNGEINKTYLPKEVREKLKDKLKQQSEQTAEEMVKEIMKLK